MKHIFLLLAFLLLLLGACVPLPLTAPPQSGPAPTMPGPTLPSSSSPTPERPLAARVNGQPIYLVDYERQVAQYQDALVASGVDVTSPEGQERLRQMRAQILEWMIEQVLIEQAAAGMGITVTDEEVQAAIAQLVQDAGSQEAFQERLERSGMILSDLQAQLRAELLRARVLERVQATVPERAEQVHARHILVDTRERAEALLGQIQVGADFAQLARTYSQDESTRDVGGDLGWFPRGVLLAPEVEEVAFSLQAGQVGPVVQSPFGYHIVQTLERKQDEPLSPEHRQLLQDRAVQSWLESLWKQAVIERFVE
ncbi:MAG: peptidylprolyl isomerase [Anaerolineae bacterium]